MSGTLNKVMLIGHLGDDVKMKHFDGGGCIGRFPLATNETYTNKSTNCFQPFGLFNLHLIAINKVRKDTSSVVCNRTLYK